MTRLAKLIKDQGISPILLARAAHIPIPQMQELLDGTVPIEPLYAARLATALSVTIEEITGEEKQVRAKKKAENGTKEIVETSERKLVTGAITEEETPEEEVEQE